MSTTLFAVDLMMLAVRAGELCRREEEEEEEEGAVILQMLDPCVNAVATESFEIEVMCALIVVVSAAVLVSKYYFVDICVPSNNEEFQGAE